tara:strand:- start:2411 stop:2947 length:537 start_codon:yes stop_codon:yes gene_type:complete
MEDNLNLDALTSQFTKGKKRINSRRKGAAFERKIAKTLNTKFDSKEFSRSPGSGAFATTHNLPTHLQLHGDILTPLKFKFVIECKSGYDQVDIFDLFDDGKDFDKFIKQAKRDGKKANKPFMLIYKKTRSRKTIVATSLGYFKNDICHLKSIDVPSKGVTLYLLEDILYLDNSKFTEE